MTIAGVTDSSSLLVVGAGPTGLTAALAGAEAGLTVRIIDQRPRRQAASKALVTHARTMEIFHSLGFADDVAAAGSPLTALQLRGSFGAHGRFALDDLDWGDTAYPRWLIIPQYEVEQRLEKALAARGITIEWGPQLTGVNQSAAAVTARLPAHDAQRLLDSYEAERRPVIKHMVARVQRVTSLVTDSRRAGRRLLGTVAPALLPHIPARQLLAQTMGGLNITYRHGPLVLGRDKLSGKRAASVILYKQSAGTWCWYTSDDGVQLIRPDGVVAVSGTTRHEVDTKIRRNRLLTSILEVVQPTP